MIPLRDHKSIYLEADFVEETARQYRKHVYDIKSVDIILVEGIFLFKHEYRSLFDLAIWVDMLIPDCPGASHRACSGRLNAGKDDRGLRNDLLPGTKIHFNQDDPEHSRISFTITICIDLKLLNQQSWPPPKLSDSVWLTELPECGACFCFQRFEFFINQFVGRNFDAALSPS